MKSTLILLLLLATAIAFKAAWKHDRQAAKPILSMFYCGFGGDFCGQSTDDDVNPVATNIILAFVDTNPDGSVYVDTQNYPSDLQSKWQAAGKNVLISVGGQNGNWAYIFASQDSTNNFVKSV